MPGRIEDIFYYFAITLSKQMNGAMVNNTLNLRSSGTEDQPAADDVEWQSDKTRMIWKEIEVPAINIIFK